MDAKNSNVDGTEETFFRTCNITDSVQARQVAAAVRLTIAQLGKAQPVVIQASESFEQLHSLPFWKKCGDVGFETDTLAEGLQRNLGMKLSASQLSKVRDPDLNVQMTVAEFVQDVWKVVEGSA